jgi:hypothetical protein
MNWHRGLLRLWLAASALWIGCVALLMFFDPVYGLGLYIFLAVGPVMGLVLLWFIAMWVVAGFRR